MAAAKCTHNAGYLSKKVSVNMCCAASLLMQLGPSGVSVRGVEHILRRHSRRCEGHVFAEAVTLHLLALKAIGLQDVALLLVFGLIVVVAFHHHCAHVQRLEVSALQHSLLRALHVWSSTRGRRRRRETE